VIEFQRAVEPLEEIVAALREQLKERAGGTDLELCRALRDVADHATRMMERVDGGRQLLVNILTVNAALVAQRQNEEITRLAEASYYQNEPGQAHLLVGGHPVRPDPGRLDLWNELRRNARSAVGGCDLIPLTS
jgi:hypothetical protein